MPRRIDSIEGGTGFREGVDLDDADLEALLDGLDQASKPPARDVARDHLVVALEDFQTARVHVVRAKTLRQDRSDAKRLRRAVQGGFPTERTGRALEALKSFEADNPVLARRLWWKFKRKRFHDLRRALEQADDLLTFADREMKQLGGDLGQLVDSLSGEHGHGPNRDRAAIELAYVLYQIWTEFSSKGTSRHGAVGREKFPFGDFVRSAGRLIDPTFDGHYYARLVHDRVRGLSDAK